MVDNNENVLVEYDYQNVILVDPNKVFDSLGNVKERLLKPENLVYYANLECSLFPRTRLAVSSSGYYNNETISIATINFMKPGGKKFLDNSYLDEITGLDSTRGLGQNQTIERASDVSKSTNSKEDYNTTIGNPTNNNLLLIESISIDTQLNLFPLVTIEMQDIRGRALFEQGENSPYAVFFNYPYPLFYLTVKGYLGKAIKYQLALKTFNARFDTSSGNFRVTCTFMAYKYNVLTQLKMEYLKAIPYMYKSNYKISPSNTSGTQTALNQVGNTIGDVETKITFRGLEKIKEVYSDYKSKGLIPDDFPVITLQDLIVRLNKLEEDILNSFQTADLMPLTDGENFNLNLDEFANKVYYSGDKSWFSTYLDETNFFIQKNTNQKVYTFKKEILEGKNKDNREIAITNLKALIDVAKKDLGINKTFGSQGQYTIGKQTFPSSIPFSITYENIQVRMSVDDIDWVATYQQRTGREGTASEISDFISKSQTQLNSIKPDGNQSNNYYWFTFEGTNNFVGLIQIMRNLLSVKLDEIQGKLATILSERLSVKDKFLGFKPTIKNVIAVILASAEAFLRIMNDVHETAWDKRENKDRINAILGGDKSAVSVDAKQSVTTTDGNLIPIYPWPQYYIETNDSKGRNFELTYPGDPKVAQKTKGYLFDVWPEIEFVEEYIRGRVTTKNIPSVSTDSVNSDQIINRVSLNAIDFPTSNALFRNRQDVKFFFELWERVYLYANYERFRGPDAENKIQEILAETEFINIKNSLGVDSPFLIKKLKNYGFNATNIIPYLFNITNQGIGESWQKYIRDIFVTGYIQSEVENSFVIYSEDEVSSNVNIVQPEPKNLSGVTSFLSTTTTNGFDLLDTFPYSIDGWYKNNLANGNGTTFRDINNTSKVYVVHENKKLISNFNITTSKTQKRPVTNFNVYTPVTPNPSLVNLKDFYGQRTGDNGIISQQITEGSINYLNYSGNVKNLQTTSMLNTPFFINAVTEGVDKWLTGDTHPYVSASYLFLNSLPVSTLREKYKTLDGTTSTDLDYISATLKKYGAIHRLPYAFILKYGSIWHRYKRYVNENVDILDDVWKDFDYVKSFDPVTNDPNKIYSLTIPGNSTPSSIVLENTTLVSQGTVTQLNVGFYPQLINKFNIFYRGYSLFSDYSDTTIQNQLDNTNSGFTLTLNADAQINLSTGYSNSNLSDVLSVNPWSVTIFNATEKRQFIIPSFGSNLNQVKYECFDDKEKLIVNVKSNPAVYNGSVRAFWALPNYGYFDQSKISKPFPTKYLKEVFSGISQQEAFSFRNSSDYTTIEEMFSVFNKDILDTFEIEFLNFSKSFYEYETTLSGSQVYNKVVPGELTLDTTAPFKNFQLLMRQMMATDYVPTTGNDSSIFIQSVEEKQFSQINNTLKNFLEYDVVVKYGNPGNFNRRLFDSYATVNNIEDKITFGYYVQNSLPTSANTSLSLFDYIALNPDAWKSLETYVGFSTQDGIKYTNTGSTITDFFIDMNIEFTQQSVITLAPLIRIYATQKKINPSLNRGSFITLLNNFLNENATFSNGVFNSLMEKVRIGLPNIDELPERTITTELQGEQTKLQLWDTFKGLNDTWIAGYDYTQTTFLEDVLILDRANRNISDEVLIDPIKVRNLLNEGLNYDSSVYSYVESLLDIHNFVCMMHPGYVNYYNVQTPQKNSTPKIDSAQDFGNNLFGTYLNVDTRAASPKLVCVYASIPSEHLYTDKNDTNKFNSDSFKFERVSDSPIIENLQNKTDWGLSNRVVAFNVDVGVRNQNVFHYFDVSQDLGKETKESLEYMNRMIEQSGGRQAATQNSSLWEFYKKRSYQCKVSSLGNMMIQPTMFFNVRYVPMFTGPYRITEVKHQITSGRFDTTFTGIREQIFTYPFIQNYMQILTKKLFTEIYETIKQKTNTNVQNDPNANQNPNNVPNNTPSNNVLTNNSDIVPNTFSIDNPQNCKTSLNSGFTNYTQATTQETRLSIKQVVDLINSNVTVGNNLPITKMLAFITVYLESYQNNEFVCWNNNFSGVKLKYKWPSALGNSYFTKTYNCQLDENGMSNPYAVFDSLDKTFNFLEKKWGPISNNYTMTAESLGEAWIRCWNNGNGQNSMSDTDYNSFKTNNQTRYQNIISEITSGMSLAKQMGL